MAQELPPTYVKWTFEDRRSKYKPEYCEGIVEWFKQQLTDLESADSTNDLPTFQRYAIHIDVCKSTLTSWREKYSEFDGACLLAETIQEAALIHGTITGKFAAAAGIFTMKNILGWRDKHDIETPGGTTITVTSAIPGAPNSEEQASG